MDPVYHPHDSLALSDDLTAARGEVSHCRTVCANRVPAVRPLSVEQSLLMDIISLGAQAQMAQGSA